MVKFLAVFLLFVAYVTCDLYLHNPKGSNDRLNEANANRNNANRLFDSQNNAKGGYCYGPQMTYYEGSLISVEWTNQHGCGSNPKLVCNIVIQYMCGETTADPLNLIRDGTTTDTIPDDPTGAATVDATTGQLLYGMHEPYSFYQDCKTRNRNMGLFIADREAQGGLTAARASAIYSRQNNNGDRYGFECQEERDYYPYWHPSVWKDIAILAQSESYCDFYKAESQNVKGKGYCTDPANPGPQTAPNNPADCAANGYTWKTQPSWGLKAPDCVKVPWSRENHLGNGADGFANRYNMTVPRSADVPCVQKGDCVCALRIRYNISTIEADHPDMSRPDTGFIDWTNNAKNSPVQEDTTIPNGDGELQLAMDTTQFGRTFEDRSYTFKIAQRPTGVSHIARVFNLNVRGKRGNIVQAYPATEYDFVPQYLYVRVGDYIHFQWTGCDTNPAGNAGEGTDQTDRSNMVQLATPDSSYPITDAWAAANPKKLLFQDSGLRLRMARLDQTNCLTLTELLAANNNNAGNAEQDIRNCGKLNGADEYFNGGVIRMNITGTFHYMSTRNHNFTNRDQKGIIYVVPLLPSWALGVVICGAALFVGAAGVAFMMFYAKSHPHSSVANMFSRM